MTRECHVRFCERLAVKLRRATHLVILIDAYKRHDRLIGAVDKRLREEFAKLQVKSMMKRAAWPTLSEGKLRVPGLRLPLSPQSTRGVAAALHAQAQKADGTDAAAQRGVPPIPAVTDRTGDKPDKSGAAGMGELLRGRAPQ